MDRNLDLRSGASGTITDEGTGSATGQVRARGVERPVSPHRAARPRRAVLAAVPMRERPVRETVSVVIPTKNEERNIAWVLRLLPEWIDEVVLVDSSTDNTIDVARAVRPDLVVAVESTPGKGAALRRGFQTARGEFIVMIDADGSMDPGEIPMYVERLAEGYDLVKGSRFMRGGGSEDISGIRQLGNRALLGMVNVLYNQTFTELCYGMMAFRADCIPDMTLRSDGFEIETEIVVRAVRVGLAISEVPSFELERRFGESNLNAFRDGRRVLRTLLVERFRTAGRPKRQLEDLSVTELPEAAVAPAEVTAAAS